MYQKIEKTKLDIEMLDKVSGGESWGQVNPQYCVCCHRRLNDHDPDCPLWVSLEKERDTEDLIP